MGSTYRPDIKIACSISIEQAYVGTCMAVNFDRIIECKSCCSRGIVESKGIACQACSGEGVSHMGGHKRCQVCLGTGCLSKKCVDCDGTGRKLSMVSLLVDIPPGTLRGSNIVLKGEGNIGWDDRKGDLLVRVDHPWETEGIYCSVEGSITKDLVVPWEYVLSGKPFQFKVFPSCRENLSFVANPEFEQGDFYTFPRLGMNPAGDLNVKVF